MQPVFQLRKTRIILLSSALRAAALGRGCSEIDVHCSTIDGTAVNTVPVLDPHVPCGQGVISWYQIGTGVLPSSEAIACSNAAAW
jgi:hypothetical protein